MKGEKKTFMNHSEFYFHSVSLYDNYVVCDSHGRGESTPNREKHIKLWYEIAQKPFGATSWDIKRHGNSLSIVSISIKCEKFYKITRYCCFNDSIPHDSTSERSTNIVGTPMKFTRVSSSDIWFAKILRQKYIATRRRVGIMFEYVFRSFCVDVLSPNCRTADMWTFSLP